MMQYCYLTNKGNDMELRYKKIVDAKELFELYGFSLSTQAKMRMKREIPFIKIGGRYVRYEIEAIEAWIKSNRVEVA